MGQVCADAQTQRALDLLELLVRARARTPRAVISRSRCLVHTRGTWRAADAQPASDAACIIKSNVAAAAMGGNDLREQLIENMPKSAVKPIYSLVDNLHVIEENSG